MPIEQLVADNIELLSSADALIEPLSEEEFNQTFEPYFVSSLGKHLRHIIDHYLTFFTELNNSVIDYDQRQRITKLESCPATARDHLQTLIQQLNDLPKQFPQNHTVSVTMSTSSDCKQDRQPVLSSLSRELMFLHSHTVHHFALMSVQIQMLDKKIDDQFGVAPSTQIYERSA